MANFSVDFRCGAVTVADQVEGAAYEDGRGLSNWDTFCKVPDNVYLNDSGDGVREERGFVFYDKLIGIRMSLRPMAANSK